MPVNQPTLGRLNSAADCLNNRSHYSFGKLKHFRRVATRYEKTAQNYLAVVLLASTILWLR